ncbi:hypothetical protein BRC97_03135 [Halobacteriales archaeon QS_6_71_20]|nr:MAG: hypothetical protein BRC97_03135 [Halobacteriales archaeon QS_6_71_20]
MSSGTAEGPEAPDSTDDDTGEEIGDSGIEVEVHGHFGMTGSFPLRICELFFASDGVHLAEYGMITPLFGLGVGKHEREAAAMVELLDRYGIDEVLARADAVTWLSYDTLDRVVVSDGGRLGNARVGLYPEAGDSHAYRIHDDGFDADAFVDELTALGEERGFDVVSESGLGYRPRESLDRFFG